MSQRAPKRSRDSSRIEQPDLSELEPSIKECVRYILSREGGKIPIKHADINKHINTVCQTPPNQVTTVVTEANKMLKKIYGYELIRVDAKTGKQYIVVLNEECDLSLPCIGDENHRRLLIAALMHIYMTGAPVAEDDMWKFLIRAGLMVEDDNASRKLLTTTFCRQLYLNYTKVQVAEAPGNVARNEFMWGQRAEVEVPKLFLLNKMAEAFEKTPDHWGEQYKAATQQDNQ